LDTLLSTFNASDPPSLVIQQTKEWVGKFVVGLNMCPFAKPVLAKGLIRYVECKDSEQGLVIDLLDQELVGLRDAQIDLVETTLFILSNWAGDFVEFQFFVNMCRKRIKTLGLKGVIQIAEFHPNYQFADALSGDISNATNQTPYPTLHLLREQSVELALQGAQTADKIVQRNQALLKEMGWDGLNKFLKEEKDFSNEP